MADEGDSGEQKITFNVKSSNDAKYVISLPLSTSVRDLKEKLSTSEYADVPPERQRLIYSGRVMKDTDTLADHKVKEGNTIHLVKSAASNQRQNPANQGSSASTSTGSPAPAAAGVPTNLAAGTGNNPLAGLTGARYAGFTGLPGAGMFGPDGGMGAGPDPEQIGAMLENPMFVAQMNEALQNPAAVEMMMNANPAFRNIPGMREFIQSEGFRRMITDPNTYRQMSQMGRMFGGMPGMGGGQNAFPAPGATDTTPAGQARSGEGAATGAGTSATPNQTNTTGTAPPPFPNPFLNPFANPFGALGGQGAGANAANPFAALFGTPAGNTPATSPPPPASAGGNQPPPNPFAMFLNPAMMGQQPAAGATPAANPASPAPEGQQQQQAQQPANPFGNLFANPEALQQMLGAFGGGQPGGGYNPFAMFGGGSPEPPAQQDTRPPEERYAEQLLQLNDMGFYEFERNVEALRRTGGSVQGAVEYLLTH